MRLMHYLKRGNDTSAYPNFRDFFFDHYPVERLCLSNGLTVLTIENHDLPVVSMYTFYKVGSRNERPGITGISHLFEHMMFNGSRKFRRKEFDRILETGGGHSNAYTSRDLTVYYEDFDSSLLETVIDLDSDRMGWLHLSSESLKSEREVVREERRLRTDNSVHGRLEEELYASSFQCHPYRWPIIGWMSDIERISLKDCRKYYKDYYAPNNALLVLSGAFHTGEALELIEKCYGCIAVRKTAQPAATGEPPQRGEKRVRYRKHAELHNFVAGYHVPAAGHEDMYVLDVLQTILTDGVSSMLYRIMTRKKAVALFVECDFTWHIDPGLFEFFIQMKPGFTSSDGEKCLEEVLNKLSVNTVTYKDLNRAKNILEADFIVGIQANNGRAHRVGSSEILLGGYQNMCDPLREYQKITPDDIKRAVSTYLKPDNKTIVSLEIE